MHSVEAAVPITIVLLTSAPEAPTTKMRLPFLLSLLINTFPSNVSVEVISATFYNLNSSFRTTDSNDEIVTNNTFLSQYDVISLCECAKKSLAIVQSSFFYNTNDKICILRENGKFQRGVPLPGYRYFEKGMITKLIVYTFRGLVKLTNHIVESLLSHHQVKHCVVTLYDNFLCTA